MNCLLYIFEHICGEYQDYSNCTLSFIISEKRRQLIDGTVDCFLKLQGTQMA